MTAYDTAMRSRECLGMWFTKHDPFTHTKLEDKIHDVIDKAQTTSRLTGGKYLFSPIYGYSISYLYKEHTKKFIRGWHGVRGDAFYLPDVFLEHTFNDGKWINDYELKQNLIKEWPRDNNFDMTETLEKLSQKAGANNIVTNYTLYSSQIVHHSLNS